MTSLIPTPSPAAPPPSDAGFGIGLLQALVAADAHGNIIVAPGNIRTALAAVATGAAGPTRTQITALTGAFDPADALSSDTTKAALMIWVTPAGQLQTAFIARLPGVEVLQGPAAQAAAAINGYVKKHTGGMISHVIDGVGNAPMVLTTALYFDGTWRVPFDPALTHAGDFHSGTKTTESVPLMRRDGRFTYADGPDGQIVQLPYHSTENLCLTVFLPRQGLPLDAWLARTDGAQWLALVKTVRPRREGTLKLPKLDAGFRSSLSSALEHMGIHEAFTRDADFSGILEHARLRIGDVVHATQVEMDEKGTKAAAATTVIMTTAMAVPPPPSPPFRMIVDRPYFFTIGTPDNQRILFAGVVRKP